MTNNKQMVSLSKQEMQQVDGGWIHIVLGVIAVIEVIHGAVDGWNGN